MDRIESCFAPIDAWRLDRSASSVGNMETLRMDRRDSCDSSFVAIFIIIDVPRMDRRDCIIDPRRFSSTIF